MNNPHLFHELSKINYERMMTGALQMYDAAVRALQIGQIVNLDGVPGKLIQDFGKFAHVRHGDEPKNMRRVNVLQLVSHASAIMHFATLSEDLHLQKIFEPNLLKIAQGSVFFLGMQKLTDGIDNALKAKGTK